MKFIVSSFQTLLFVSGLFSVAFARTAKPSFQRTSSPTTSTDLTVDLGTAKLFAILAGTTITSTGQAGTVVYGDMGVNPGSAIDGFPPAKCYGTTATYGDSGTAQNDLTAAYNDAAGRAPTSDLSNADLGGMTLAHGVYKFSSAAALNGMLTLDARGDIGAVWIFQIGDTLMIAQSSSIIFKDGLGNPDNIYWQVSSSADINHNAAVQGNFMALQAISVSNSASVVGRLLARNAAVTLDFNSVTMPELQPSAVPTAAPSARPTSQNSPLLVFNSNLTLSGMTTATLSANGQHALINATATCMGILEESEEFLRSESTQTARRALWALTHKVSLLATYDLLTFVQTQVTLSSTSYGSIEEMYTALTTKLAAAVSNGQFTDVLQRNSIMFDAPELSTATGSSVTTNDPVIVYPENSSKDKLSDGAIAGIVIGVVVFVVLCAALIFYFCVHSSTGSESKAASSEPTGKGYSSAPAAEARDVESSGAGNRAL